MVLERVLRSDVFLKGLVLFLSLKILFVIYREFCWVLSLTLVFWCKGTGVNVVNFYSLRGNLLCVGMKRLWGTTFQSMNIVKEL